jgi:hypothetical protein
MTMMRTSDARACSIRLPARPTMRHARAPVASAVGLLHMMGLRGSRVVTSKIRRGPFDVRQMESEIQPGLARVREDVRRRTARLASSASARGRR